MQLKSGTLLQNGKYRIEKVLGQGGFGITYLAVQTALDRKVAIKEFFMKDYCNRDSDTSHVSVPSIGSKELVFKFRNKFIREAKMIAAMENPHIVTIYEVFEENGTAYYVMQYVEGGSLESKVPMKPDEAEIYIRQIADALDYCHDQKILHLDVKPSNVMLNKGKAVLIDFGISKHYDEGGDQTSSTPVGISKGYAPLEQYDRGDISSFTPCTDIYSLGATFYKLLTGQTPPEANKVNEEGIHIPDNIPMNQRHAITFAMQPKRKDRPQSIDEFLAILDSKTSPKEDTYVEVKVEPEPDPDPAPVPVPVPHPLPKRNWMILLIMAVVLCFGGYYAYDVIENKKAEAARLEKENKEREEREAAQLAQAQKEAMLSDKQKYLSLIGEGDKLQQQKKYSESINKYEQAQVYEEKYKGSEYTSEFDKDASAKIRAAEETARLEKERKEREAAERAEAERLEKERKEREAAAAAEAARLEKERKEREAAAAAEAARLEKERQQPGTAEYNRTHGSANGHGWVDLGLPSGLKWATCNVGANRPEDYGDYYAWGETSTKSSYTENNSKTYGKSYSDIGSRSQYDAARANWGGSWRLPTKAELEELENKCKWTWTTQGGKNGYKVTGPNGNSIFLPAAGQRYRSVHTFAGRYGFYWSSTPYEGNSDEAYYLTFYSGTKYVYYNGRYNGQSVRPVSE